MSVSPRYCAYYCEENVWHLCGDPSVPAGHRVALFISNRGKAVAMAHQRLSIIPGFPIIWDYHVVMALHRQAQGWTIWDLDSGLGLDVALAEWADKCFGGKFGFGAEHAPVFGVVAGEVYRAQLSSDRSHMRDPEGNYRVQPPAWPAIGEAPSNLMRHVAMESPWVTEVAELAQLPAALDRAVGIA